MFNKENIEEAVSKSWNMTELAINLGYQNPGTNIKRKLKKIMDSLGIDYSNLRKTARPKFKYERKIKSCPICQKEFETQIGSRKERTTCSYSCSNSFFRSGKNNPNYKDGSGTNYRKTAFAKKKAKCERCNWNIEKNVLQIHHIDRDRSNNHILNLEILCPNCHALEHYYAHDGLFHNNNDSK